MVKPKPKLPLAGQESVWDYPRPPKLEKTAKLIQVYYGGQVIAATREAYRVLETSHPPVYYLPQKDIAMKYVRPVAGYSYCEWKGRAAYYDVVVGEQIAVRAAWSYRKPTPAFISIKDYLAFYAGKMDRCLVDGEVVKPQPGDFYGGWITPDVVGPFKGEPASWGW